MQVTLHGQTQPFRTVAFDLPSREVRLIEQRLLPHEFKAVGLNRSQNECDGRAVRTPGESVLTSQAGSEFTVLRLVTCSPMAQLAQ